MNRTTAAAAVIVAAAAVVGAGSTASAATAMGQAAGAPAGAAVTAASTRQQPRPGSGWMGGRGAARGSGKGSGQAAGGRGGNGSGGGAGGGYDIPPAVPGATISAEVAEKLQYMVAEEKLARDLYALAAKTYGTRNFSNISASESRHMAEIQVLLSRYQVSDPTVGDPAGKFDNADLQALYDKLAAQVRSGLTQANQAGVTVEKTDIADLDKALALSAPADVKTVLGNLKAGSQRHLASFQRWA